MKRLTVTDIPNTILPATLIELLVQPGFQVSVKNLAGWIWLLSVISGFGVKIAPAQAQSIVPARDGINTAVKANGNIINISGGQLSGDRANLFHSFQQFGLNPNQVANFLANPNLQNILGRVVGGDPSTINGMLRVSGGNANLFLLNPAGIVFGANSRLDLNGSFTATTANAGWFHTRKEKTVST